MVLFKSVPRARVWLVLAAILIPWFDADTASAAQQANRPGTQASGQGGEKEGCSRASARTRAASSASHAGADAGSSAPGPLQPGTAYDCGRELDPGGHSAGGAGANRRCGGGSSQCHRAGGDAPGPRAGARCPGSAAQWITLQLRDAGFGGPSGQCGQAHPDFQIWRRPGARAACNRDAGGCRATTRGRWMIPAPLAWISPSSPWITRPETPATKRTRSQPPDGQQQVKTPEQLLRELQTATAATAATTTTAAAATATGATAGTSAQRESIAEFSRPQTKVRLSPELQSKQ